METVSWLSKDSFMHMLARLAFVDIQSRIDLIVFRLISNDLPLHLANGMFRVLAPLVASSLINELV